MAFVSTAWELIDPLGHLELGEGGTEEFRWGAQRRGPDAWDGWARQTQ